LLHVENSSVLLLLLPVLALFIGAPSAGETVGYYIKIGGDEREW